MNTAPPFITDFDLSLPSYDKMSLNNEVPLYSIKQSGIDILKFEIQIIGGRSNEVKKGIAQACGALLKYGTSQYTSEEIDELIELKGATLNTRSSLDTIIIEIYCLSKHFDKLLPIMADIYFNPIFPQKEINKYINRKKEELKEDLTQNDTISYRMLTEHIYGKDHPYGYNSSPQVYDNISQQDLIQHHKNTFSANQTYLFLSGDFNNNHTTLIQDYFNKIAINNQVSQEVINHKYIPKTINHVNEGTTQSAIKTGWYLFNKSHKDFTKMYVVNTILGGYFGARLMTNIRETKGLTYSIYSSLDTMMHGGFMWIDTELSHENVKEALLEIQKEINLLKSELMPIEELEMVKSYLQGNLLTMLDGPFNQLDIIKAYVLEDLDIKGFENLIHTIKNITIHDVLDVSKKYLKTENMTTIIVGDEAS